MAIYHCSLRVFSRADGHSAVAAAAYRAGTVLHDERRGLIHRYHNRRGVVQSFILAPMDAPDHVRDRVALWNAAERSETRKNARIAREIILALPHELPADMRAELARDTALWLVERYGVVVDTSLHSPVAGDGHDPRNHHAHLLFTTRAVTRDGLGPKTRVLDDRESGPKEVEIIRTIWETLANNALTSAGFESARIDRRTLDDQGIERIPQIHIGPEGKAAKANTVQTDDDREGEDDESGDQEDGSGDSTGGKQGGGGDKAPVLTAAPVTEDNPQPKDATEQADQKREVDYQAIDQGRSRAELVEDIKSVNEVRKIWPDIPLIEQIRALDHEMTRLDHRVRHFETLYARTGLSSAVRKSILDVVRYSRDLLFTRILHRDSLRLSEDETRTRTMRQGFRYGRSYRAGIHDQIRTMKHRMAILKEMSASIIKYKSFVESIETAIRQSPAMGFEGVAVPEPSKDRHITAQEFAIKLTLRAELLRDPVPDRFAPVLKGDKGDKPATGLSKSFNDKGSDGYKPPPTAIETMTTAQDGVATALTAQTSAAAPAQPQDYMPQPLQSRDRQVWFTPANDRMKEFADRVDMILNAQRQERGDHESGSHASQDYSNYSDFHGTFHAGARYEKKASYESAREKTRTEAKEKRENIPPEHRREPHPTETPKSSKMSGAFNKSASPPSEDRKPPPGFGPDYQP